MKTYFVLLLLILFSVQVSYPQQNSAKNVPFRIQDNTGSNGWSPNGRLFVTYTRRDEKTRLWELQNERLLWEVTLDSDRGESLNVQTFFWSDSQKYLLVKDQRGMIYLLDPSNGKVFWKKEVSSKNLKIVRFGPNESQIILLFSKQNKGAEIEMLNVRTGKAERVFDTPVKYFDSFAFSDDGKVVKFGGFEGKADFVSADNGKVIKSLTLRPCGTLQNTFSNKTTFSPKLNYLVSRCRDKTVITDSATGKVLRILKMRADFDKTIGFSGDEKVVVLGDLSGYKVFNVADHSVSDVASFDLWFEVDLNRDGSLLINNSGYRNRGYEIAEVKTGKVIKNFENHPGEIKSLAFSSDGERFASGSKDRVVRIWDTKTRRILYSLFGHTDEVESVQFADGDKKLISKSEKEAILWNAETGKKVSVTKGKYRFEENRNIALSQNGNLALVEEYDKPFRLMNAKTNETIKEFVYVDQLDSLVFTPDERYFLAKPWWSGWQLWSVASGNPVREFDIGYSYYNLVAFHPNGKIFITGGAGQNIMMFNLETGEKIWSLFPIDVEEFEQKKAGEAARIGFLKWRKDYAERADIDNKFRIKRIAARFSHYGDAESFWNQKLAESGEPKKSKLRLPKEKASVAWFTLTNDSEMPVSIDTNSMMFSQKCKGLCNGAEISSRYVMELKNGENRVNGYDSYSKTILPPKTTVYFSVALDHFAASKAIYLGFTFQKDNPGDERSDDYGNEQKLYIKESELPSQ